MPTLMEDQMATSIVAVRSIPVMGTPKQTEYKNCFGTIIKWAFGLNYEQHPKSCLQQRKYKSM